MADHDSIFSHATRGIIGHVIDHMLKLTGRFVERVAYPELKLRVAFPRTEADDRESVIISLKELVGCLEEGHIEAQLTEQIAQLDAIALTTPKVRLFRLPVEQPVCKASHARPAVRLLRHTLALLLIPRSIHLGFLEGS